MRLAGLAAINTVSAPQAQADLFLGIEGGRQVQGPRDHVGVPRHAPAVSVGIGVARLQQPPEALQHVDPHAAAALAEHAARTGSLVARNVLASWERGARDRFVKVMPRDFKRALAEQAEREAVEA